MLENKSEQTLESYISEKLNLDKKSETFISIYSATVRYLAKGFNSIADYHKELQKEVDFKQFEFSAADFRLELCSVCAFVLKIRFYALSICMAKEPKSVVLSYGSFGVSKQDAVLVWNNCLKDTPLRKKILKIAKSKSPQGIMTKSMVSPEELRNRINQTSTLFDEIHKNATRMCRSKLRWVSTANNIPMQDLTCDIVCQVLVSYYQSLPNDYTFQHQLSCLRTALTNRVRNMNNYYSADKRKRMHKVGEDKYEILVMSDNQLQKAFGTEDDAVNYENMLGEDARIHTSQMENSLTINKLLEDSAGTKRHKLYSTVLGRDCGEFTEYLRSENMLKDTMTCSSEWLMIKPNSFIKKVLARWLGLSVETISGGLDTLRNSLQTS